MSKEIWVVLEHRDGTVKKASLETVAIGRKLADESSAKLCAILLGESVEGLCPEAAKWGADEVLYGEDESLRHYNAHQYSDVIGKMAKERSPWAILAAATPNGKDLAPRLAAKLDSGLISDCISVENTSEGKLLAKRPVYAGKIHASVEFKNAEKQVITLRPKVIEAQAQEKEATTRSISEKPSPEAVKTVVKEVLARSGDRPELGEADIIVSGGRGVKSQEGFKVLEDLADSIGAAVGASRSAVDAGYREHASQVGQTGKVVNPKLYIACGISGAIQHLVGMGDSKYIVAINKDAEAPIFKKADYGIVGDLFEVVPLLTEEFKKAKA